MNKSDLPTFAIRQNNCTATTKTTPTTTTTTTDNTSILKLDYRRYKAVCEALDLNSTWRNLVAILDKTKFSLRDTEREECARALYRGMDGSPSNLLLTKLDMMGMSVQTLIYFLNKLKLERCLMYIKAQEPLEILSHPPKNLQVHYGSKLEIHCQATGFPYPEFVWFKEEIKVACDKEGKFVIKNVKFSDAGRYTCRVQHYTPQSGWKYLFTNSCEVKIKEINNMTADQPTILSGKDNELNTLYEEIQKNDLSNLPQILVQPTCQSNSYGGVVTFKVKAQHKYDELLYQWFFNNNPILDATESELRLDDIRREHEGRYQVRVYCQNNHSLQILSNEVTLEVIRKPNQYTADNKVALIIGNSTYRSYGYALPAIKSDMVETTEVFEKMGFKVISLLDLTLNEMKKAVTLFCDLLSADSYGILYFLGHGYVYNNRHCLVPWDSSQGNDVCESLCIETCIDQVQLKQPKLLMVFVDICRQQVEHSREADFDLKISNHRSPANKVIFYASSMGEKSYETTERGLFNKYLLEVLKNRMVTISQMYGMLKSRFQECKVDLEKHPQHSEMTTNIDDPDRSLWDPVILKDSSKYDLWDKSHALPDNICIKLPENGIVKLSFHKKMSNVLTIKVEIVNFNSEHDFIGIEIPEDCVNQVLRPVDAHQSNLCFDFYNLQRLKEDMTLSMTITILNKKVPSKCQQFKTQLINLGKPLISSINFFT